MVLELVVEMTEELVDFRAVSGIFAREHGPLAPTSLPPEAAFSVIPKAPANINES